MGSLPSRSSPILRWRGCSRMMGRARPSFSVARPAGVASLRSNTSSMLTNCGLRSTTSKAISASSRPKSSPVSSGKPVLYYTYNPYWVSQVLAPDKDVVQLTVPFTSLPTPTDPKLTTLPDGRNIGFTVNMIDVVGSRHFLEANPPRRSVQSCEDPRRGRHRGKLSGL